MEEELKLPEPYGWFDIRGEAADGFTADQMREYARQAVLAEREKLARMCESMMDPQDDGWDACLREVAAAIRKG